jgi:hypothetical protein
MKDISNRILGRFGVGPLSVENVSSLDLVLFAKDGGTSYMRTISFPCQIQSKDFRDGILISRDYLTGRSKPFAKIVMRSNPGKKTAKGEKAGS